MDTVPLIARRTSNWMKKEFRKKLASNSVEDNNDEYRAK